jgi:hypothetical protein
VNGEQFRELLEEFLPEDVLMQAVTAAGFQERERKLDALVFLRAMVLAASGPASGRQADVMRLYFDLGAERVARASFYDWFGSPLEQLMKQLSDIAVARVAREPCDLPGFLGCVKDWRIVDSTTVKLDNRLKGEFPGAGDYAALKVHKVMSVGRGATIAYHFSPARDHDSPHLVLDESWRGFGLLADLGYASIERLRDCERFGVQYVIRLKDGWKPKVQRITRGEVAKTFTPGTELNLLILEEVLVLDGRAIDAEVTFSSGDDTLQARLVGILLPNGTYGFFLTNLPASIGPRQIADLYRVRWEIETNNKRDKSCHRLDHIDARRPAAVRALLHASMVASIIVCLFAHTHQLAEAPPPGGSAERTTPPIHPQTMSRMLSVMASGIAELMTRPGPDASERWRRNARLLIENGQDPNWRRSPSILDQLRGWRISPGRPRSQRLNSSTSANRS